MSTLAPILINWLQQYGYPALWITTFIAALGIPLPISLVLLAGGAFSALGDFNPALLALISVTASVSGDSVGYLLGRKWGSKIFNWLGRQQRFRFISPEAIARSRSYFNKRGGLAVFLSRFLFSGLGGSINLLTGAELYPYSRFFLYDLAGEILGALIPLSLGYIFGASWEAVGDVLSTASLALLGLSCAIYFCWRFIKQLRRVRHARALFESKKASGELKLAGQKSATLKIGQTYTKETDAYL